MTNARSIMLFISPPSQQLATLVYLCKPLFLKYVLPIHISLSAQNSTTSLPLLFSPGTPKAPVLPSLTSSPIHPFTFPKIHNLYPFLLYPTLSISFQNTFLSSPSPSERLYPTTTQTLTLENLNLIQRILELTHPKSITALCYTLLKRMVTPSLALSIS